MDLKICFLLLSLVILMVLVQAVENRSLKSKGKHVAVHKPKHHLKFHHKAPTKVIRKPHHLRRKHNHALHKRDVSDNEIDINPGIFIANIPEELFLNTSNFLEDFRYETNTDTVPDNMETIISEEEYSDEYDENAVKMAALIERIKSFDYIYEQLDLIIKCISKSICQRHKKSNDQEPNSFTYGDCEEIEKTQCD